MNPSLDIFNSYAESQSVSIELVSHIQEDCVVEIDKFRVQQILINLVSNSVKFSK